MTLDGDIAKQARSMADQWLRANDYDPEANMATWPVAEIRGTAIVTARVATRDPSYPARSEAVCIPMAWVYALLPRPFINEAAVRDVIASLPNPFDPIAMGYNEEADYIWARGAKLDGQPPRSHRILLNDGNRTLFLTDEMAQ